MIILQFILSIALFTGIALLAKRISRCHYREEDQAFLRRDSSSQVKDVRNNALIACYVFCAIFAILTPLVITGSNADLIFLVCLTLATILMLWQAYLRKNTYYLMNKEQVSLIERGELRWQVQWKDITLAHRFIRVQYVSLYYGELVFNLFLRDGQVLKFLPQEIEPYLQEHGIEILRK